MRVKVGAHRHQIAVMMMVGQDVARHHARHLCAWVNVERLLDLAQVNVLAVVAQDLHGPRDAARRLIQQIADLLLPEIGQAAETVASAGQCSGQGPIKVARLEIGGRWVARLAALLAVPLVCGGSGRAGRGRGDGGGEQCVQNAARGEHQGSD